MEKQPDPATFTLDVTGANGTPFRFVYEAGDRNVRYYDRRYPTQPDEQHYHPRNYNEDGQMCGPALLTESFTRGHGGILGWHEVNAWNIDWHTVRLVGNWIMTINERVTP